MDATDQPGRPKRTAKLTVWLTPVEKAKIQAGADKHGLSVATYVRIKLFGTLPFPYPLAGGTREAD